jgi:hypothetical protein
MSHHLTVVSGAALAVAVLFAPAARAADEPKDILAKAIKAHGGAEALTKNKAARFKSKGKIDLPGVGEADFTQEVAFMVPGKFKESMELTVAGQTISVVTLVNGKAQSIEVNGKGIDLTDAMTEALKDAGQLLEIGRLVPLTDKKYELSIIGEDTVEGKKVVGVRVASKGRKDVSLYFDKETGLLAKLEYRTVDAQSGNEIGEERIITGYNKNKAGVAIPKAAVVKRDGKKFLEVEVVEYTSLEKLDDSEFKK